MTSLDAEDTSYYLSPIVTIGLSVTVRAQIEVCSIFAPIRLQGNIQPNPETRLKMRNRLLELILLSLG